MNQEPIYIGQLIANELKRQDKSVQWLADEYGTSLQNMYRIFKATSLDTRELYRFSRILKCNFFAQYANHFDISFKDVPLRKNDRLLEDDMTLKTDYIQIRDKFFFLIEPFLKSVGYKGRIHNGIMTVKMDDLVISIFHVEPQHSNLGRVYLRYSIRDERLKQLNVISGSILANELSNRHRSLNVTYDYQKRCIKVMYSGSILKPYEIVHFLDDSNELYVNLYEDCFHLLPDIIQLFQEDDN